MQKVVSAMASFLRSADRATARLVGAPLPQWGTADPFSCLMPWDLTTKDSLEVPNQCAEVSKSTLLERCSKLLDFAGVCTIRNAIDPELTSRCSTAADDLTKEVRQLLLQHGIDPDGSEEFSFPGVHQRDPGRMDLRNHFMMDKSPFDDPSMNENAAWMPLVHQALGPDAQLRYKGLVVAEPGTGNQDYHPDTPYVPRAEWMRHRTLDTHNTLLPPHCLVVFIPTVDLTDANGPTAFLPGSQHHTLYMENLLAEATEPGCTSGARLPAVLDVDAGDAVVMDARLQHAGTANRSDTRRTLLYLVYTCKWFTVDLHKRLLEESGLVAPGGMGQAEGLFRLRGTGD